MYEFYATYSFVGPIGPYDVYRLILHYKLVVYVCARVCASRCVRIMIHTFCVNEPIGNLNRTLLQPSPLNPSVNVGTFFRIEKEANSKKNYLFSIIYVKQSNKIHLLMYNK